MIKISTYLTPAIVQHKLKVYFLPHFCVLGRFGVNSGQSSSKYSLLYLIIYIFSNHIQLFISEINEIILIILVLQVVFQQEERNTEQSCARLFWFHRNLKSLYF